MKKIDSKKTILLSFTSALLAIAGGITATQASFTDSPGTVHVQGQSLGLMILPWQYGDSFTVNGLTTNQPQTLSSTISFMSDGPYFQIVMKIDSGAIVDKTFINATTVTAKIDGVTVYNGPLNSLSTTPIILGGPPPQKSTVPIELTVKTNTTTLNKNQLLNSVPVKFEARTVAPPK